MKPYADCIECVELDPLNRVIVDYCQGLYDYDAPYWWYESARVIEIPSSYVPRRTRISHNAEDLEAITDALKAAGISYTAEMAASCYETHLTRAGLEVSEFYDPQGVRYMVASDPREVDAGTVAEYVRAWISGEIYEMTLEHLTRYYSDAGKIREKWEAVGTVGSIYELDVMSIRDEAESWGSREIVDPVAYELQDSHGAPQCGVEFTYFTNADDIEMYLDNVEGLRERLEEGYALIKEVA